MMKKLLFAAILVMVYFNSNAQNFDLIVTIDGQMIACKIDSVSKTTIYFKMMEADYKWTQKSLKIEDVKEYKFKALDKKVIIFKPGTTIIEELIEEEEDIKSVKEIKKNTVSFELAGNGIFFSLNYDRFIPITNHIGFDFRVGYGLLFNIFVGEYTIMIGGPKHFIETGVGCSSDFQFYSFDIRTGYRFQGKNGLMFRAAPLVDYNKFNDSNQPWSLWYGVALGYTF